MSEAERGAFSARTLGEILQRVSDSRTTAYMLVSDGMTERCCYFPVGGLRLSSVGVRQGRTLRERLERHPDFDNDLLRALDERPPAPADAHGEALASGIETVVDEPAQREILHACCREAALDELCDMIVWRGAQYEYREGNPPPKLFDPEIQAVKVSLGRPALFAEVHEKIRAWGKIASKFSAPDRQILQPGDNVAQASTGRFARSVLSTIVEDGACTVEAAISAGRRARRDAVSTCQQLLTLVDRKVLTLSAAPPLSPAERKQRLREQVDLVEAAIRRMIDGLMARRTLAARYEELGEAQAAAASWRVVGAELEARGDPEGALEAFEAVSRLRPSAFYAWEKVAQLNQALGRIPAAAAAWLGLAQRYAAQGLLNRARAALLRVIKLEPGVDAHRRRLIQVLAGLGRRDEIAEQYRLLAKRCLASGDDEGAIACYQQLLEASPDDEEALAALRAQAPARRRLGPIVALAGFLVALLGLSAFVITRYQAIRAFREARAASLERADALDFDGARNVLAGFEVAHPAYGREALAGVRDGIDTLEALEAKRRFGLAHAHEQEGALADAEVAYHDVAFLFEGTEWGTRARAWLDALVDRRADVDRGLARLRSLRKAGDVEAAFAHGRELLAGEPLLTDPAAVELPLRVVSVPPGAEVSLAGARRGHTPDTLWLPATPGTLRLSLRGYRSQEHAYAPLAPDASCDLEAHLLRSPRWEVATLGPLRAPPALSARLVVLAGSDQRVYGVTPSGSASWTHRLAPFTALSGPPVAGAARVVICDTAGEVTALDLLDGAVAWRVRVDAARELRTASLTAEHVVLRGARQVVVLALDDGRELWRSQADPAADVVVAADHVVVPSRSGALIGFKDGKPRFRLSTVARATAAPTRVPGGFVVPGEDGKLRLVWDSVRWTVDLPELCTAPAMYDEALGLVFVAAGKHALALRASDGEVVWQQRLEAPLLEPCVGGGRVYVATRGGMLHALLASNGEERWSFRAGRSLSAPPRLLDDVVLLASEDCSLYAIRD